MPSVREDSAVLLILLIVVLVLLFGGGGRGWARFSAGGCKRAGRRSPPQRSLRFVTYSLGTPQVLTVIGGIDERYS